MSNSNTSLMVSPPEYSENGTKQPEISNKPPSQLPLHPNRSSSQGPVAILWDIENCPVPSDVRSEDVGGNIRMALRVHPTINGAVTMFSAYGDFNAFPRRLREGCQRTGVKLIDVPNGRKDAADKAILVDMFLFALDNRPPSSIMLISGDVDFAPALHILGQRGYTVILVIPSGVGVSSALSNAGRFVWDWPSVARGEGFVPPGKALSPPWSRLDDVSGFLVGCQINDVVDCQNEEEAIVYRGTSKNYHCTRDFSVVSQSQSVHNGSTTLIPRNPSSSHNGSSTLIPPNRTNSKSHNVSSGLKQAPSKPLTSCEQDDLVWVQPGDLNGLKGQLIKLLELFGGILPLIRLPAEYHKIYGRPLYVSEYGALKLVHILNKMSDVISVEGKGHMKHICLRTSKPGRVGGPIILARRDKKEKEPQQDTFDATSGNGSSDEFSDEERVIFGVKHDREEGGQKLNAKMTDQSVTVSESLKRFKYELQEILVSYSCKIFLGCFEAIYQQKYRRQLDYVSFGVNCLEELLAKVRDVVALQEEPVNKRKYMVAIGG